MDGLDRSKLIPAPVVLAVLERFRDEGLAALDRLADSVRSKCSAEELPDFELWRTEMADSLQRDYEHFAAELTETLNHSHERN